MKHTAKTTIKDVAKLAGVSLMTVSRAIHNPELVADKTKQQVQAAIEQLNYIPDISAGNLSSKKSNTIAVLLPSLQLEGHVRTVEGFSQEIRKNGYHLLLGDYSYSPTEEMELLRIVLGNRPAGVVFINSVCTQQGAQLLKASGVPVIETWSIPKHPLDLVVGFSHRDVGFAITTHLVEQGFKKIVFLGASTHNDLMGKERQNGVKSALKKHKLDDSRVIAIDQMPQDMLAGKIGIQTLIQKYPDADALICLNDKVAMGALMECRRQNIVVPDQLAITGHGGSDFAQHLVPSLTTTEADGFEIGVNAAKLLQRRIDGLTIEREDAIKTVEFNISIGESTQISKQS